MQISGGQDQLLVTAPLTVNVVQSSAGPEVDIQVRARCVLPLGQIFVCAGVRSLTRCFNRWLNISGGWIRLYQLSSPPTRRLCLPCQIAPSIAY